MCVLCCRRLLAEEDVAAGPGPISAAAGDDGAELYTAGGVEAAGFDAAKFNLYLVRKVRAAASVAISSVRPKHAMSNIVCGEFCGRCVSRMPVGVLQWVCTAAMSVCRLLMSSGLHISRTLPSLLLTVSESCYNMFFNDSAGGHVP
jgi:hypothetical protein